MNRCLGIRDGPQLSRRRIIQRLYQSFNRVGGRGSRTRLTPGSKGALEKRAPRSWPNLEQKVQRVSSKICPQHRRDSSRPWYGSLSDYFIYRRRSAKLCTNTTLFPPSSSRHFRPTIVRVFVPSSTVLSKGYRWPSDRAPTA